jgi:threonyl-tRNA synthetase
LDRNTLLEMFKYSKYKVHFIKDKIPEGGSTTVYRCGPLIDLCTGPHIPHTGRIKAFSVMKNSSAYWLGDAKNDSLQRIYGVSFPDKKQMTEYKAFLAEAAKRDHRRIGKDQELFFFDPLSPGSAFFLPHGMRIYNTLQSFIREEYHARGFQEVGTPNMFNSKLWETSGHWQNYKEDMFLLSVDKEQFALKPMNCPGHCIMFKSRKRTYREFPIRYADFGVLHRNEASGALTGLTRVRRFQQDDAHIFCREDQVKDEMVNCFMFLDKVYRTFGFTFNCALSTRNPDKFLGSLETWERAEKALADAMDEHFGSGKWRLNPEDGAFYGPKVVMLRWY